MDRHCTAITCVTTIYFNLDDAYDTKQYNKLSIEQFWKYEKLRRLCCAMIGDVKLSGLIQMYMLSLPFERKFRAICPNIASP